MASAMLRSVKSAISRTLIPRRSFFPVESDPARKLIATAASSAAAAAAGQPLSLLTRLSPLVSGHSLSHIAASPAADAAHINSRSEAFVKYSTAAAPSAPAADVPKKAFDVTTLRPLSPHLTIFKPQLNSTVSISNRISAALIVAIVLFSYLLCLKVGGVCFTYPSFYQLFFYSSKYLVPVGAEITALALAFHLFYAIRHMIR